MTLINRSFAEVKMFIPSRMQEENKERKFEIKIYRKNFIFEKVQK